MQNKVHGFKLNGHKSGCLEKYNCGSRTNDSEAGYINLHDWDERKKSGTEEQPVRISMQ